MKKSKKTIFLFLLTLAVIATISISGAVAYMFQQTEQVSNKLLPAKVECTIVEDFDANKGEKSSVQVQHSSNVPVYIRLRAVSYWQDSKGNIVARNSPAVTIPYDNAKWIEVKSEGGNMYYCKTPVAVGSATPELLEKTFTLPAVVVETEQKEIGKDATGNPIYTTITYTYHPVVEFVAEAIQAEPANEIKKTLESEKLQVTLDSDNIITSIVPIS